MEDGLEVVKTGLSSVFFNTLDGLGGGLRSLELGGKTGCWFPKPYEIVVG